MLSEVEAIILAKANREIGLMNRHADDLAATIRQRNGTIAAKNKLLDEFRDNEGDLIKIIHDHKDHIGQIERQSVVTEQRSAREIAARDDAITKRNEELTRRAGLISERDAQIHGLMEDAERLAVATAAMMTKLREQADLIDRLRFSHVLEIAQAEGVQAQLDVVLEIVAGNSLDLKVDLEKVYDAAHDIYAFKNGVIYPADYRRHAQIEEGTGLRVAQIEPEEVGWTGNFEHAA